VIDQQPLELLAGVLAAAIGVMQQRVGLSDGRSPRLLSRWPSFFDLASVTMDVFKFPARIRIGGGPRN
jgi:hypothetical protein